MVEDAVERNGFLNQSPLGGKMGYLKTARATNRASLWNTYGLLKRGKKKAVSLGACHHFHGVPLTAYPSACFPSHTWDSIRGEFERWALVSSRRCLIFSSDIIHPFFLQWESFARLQTFELCVHTCVLFGRQIQGPNGSLATLMFTQQTPATENRALPLASPEAQALLWAITTLPQRSHPLTWQPMTFYSSANVFFYKDGLSFLERLAAFLFPISLLSEFKLSARSHHLNAWGYK